MAPRTTRRILWLGGLLLAPLPMLGTEAWIPVSRYLLLAGVTAGLIIAEGAATIPNVFFFLLLGHAVVYGGLLWLGAWVGSRLLHRLVPRAAGAVACALVLAAAALAVATPLYVTPFAATSARANLLHVLE